MKRNILNAEAEQQMVDRILKLNPASEGLWGDMTVNEMLFHCRKVHNEILKAEQKNNLPTVKQKIMKTIGLYLMKKFPKGVKTGPRFLPERKDNIEFEKVQNELISSIKQVSNSINAIYGEHPFFGPLNTAEWRHFMWKHLDHHLRQFNV